MRAGFFHPDFFGGIGIYHKTAQRRKNTKKFNQFHPFQYFYNWYLRSFVALNEQLLYFIKTRS
jgi:hypothetical protein